MTEEIKVRSLIVDDGFALAKILGKITKPARFQIIGYLKKMDKPHTRTENIELILTIIQSLFVEANDDIKVWLADIAQVDIEAFRKMPLKTLMDVGKQIASLPDIADFLSGLSGLLPEESPQTSTSSKKDTAGQTK